MLNDFTGGGQIFLHKIHMFMQVFDRSLSTSIIVSIVITCCLSYQDSLKCDWQAALSYNKAYIAYGFNEAMSDIRSATNRKNTDYVSLIDTYTKDGLYERKADVRKVIRSSKFRAANNKALSFLKSTLFTFTSITLGIFSLIFLAWVKFGSSAREEKHLGGSVIKSEEEIARYLKRKDKASKFKIGNMPLVKDSETKHILITGTTGSGKTNLINTLLPQIRMQKQPALVLDQTGEMIARYYDEERGDIIFNPLDQRSHTWDFFSDVGARDSANNPAGTREGLEKFAKALFGFGKLTGSNSDPFWTSSAETVFCACVESLIRLRYKHTSTDNSMNIARLKTMLSHMTAQELKILLKDTEASRYLEDSNKNTAASILSVMATSTKPLNYLFESNKSFSLKQYFDQVKAGSDAWLFFATSPSKREVTLPLIAGMFELAVSDLMSLGIDEKRRMWFIIDELAALGKLNGFNSLMSESRKYGGCVLAATQSVNQLFENFGNYSGNSIFGQFSTKFFFRNDEPAMAKIITDIFGQIEYQTQQKNTSFGANEIHDGVSYTEQTKRKSLITSDDLATLSDLECFVGLPEPEVRIGRIKLRRVNNVFEKNEGFVPLAREKATIPVQEALDSLEPKMPSDDILVSSS